MNAQELRDKIVAVLKADATLQSLLGSSPMKLYYNRPRKGLALPCVTYSILFDTPDVTMDQYGDFTVEVQIDVWSTSIDTAEAIHEAVTKALWDQPGSLTSTNYRVRRVRRTGGGTIPTGEYKEDAEILQVTQTWALQVNDKAY